MKDCSESQEEATGWKTLFSTRRTTTIGAWNVETMFQPGKAQIVAAEMRRYGLDIPGLSEVRAGQLRLTTGELLLYSGHQDDDAIHSEGVALMLSKRAQGALIGRKDHGPRLLTACFKINNKKRCNVVQCYAPTNMSEDQRKDDFYERLQ